MWQPEMDAFDGEDPDYPSSDYLLMVLKALYGTKQSGRMWYLHISRQMKSWKFIQLNSEACIFLRRDDKGEVILIVCIYVDDVISIAKEYKYIDELWSLISAKYPLKILGEVKEYLGIEVNYKKDAGTIFLHQRSYAEKVLKRFSMFDSNPVATPVAVSWQVDVDSPKLSIIYANKYRAIVGSIMYLTTSTRPDLYFLTVILARGMQDPTESHMSLAKRGLRYLKGTMDFGLTFDTDQTLIGYSDADFASAEAGRKSLTGYIFMYKGSTVSASTKQQSLVCLSTCEAEYVALSMSAREGLYLRQLARELGIRGDGPVIILGDNECANLLTGDTVTNQRTKHIDVRYHHIRQLVQDKVLEVKRVPTEHNLADLFTKALPKDRFRKLTSIILGQTQSEWMSDSGQQILK